MKINRHKTRVIKIGNIRVGGNNPVAIQSMVKAKTSDTARVVNQIKELEAAGCEIVRLAIKDTQDAAALREIRRETKMPLVADIHFHQRLAIEAIESGVDKIRLNPGNIYKDSEIRLIVSALKSAKIPLRVGLNSGSVKGPSNAKAGMPERLAASALSYIKKIEKLKFRDIVVSLKASNVLDTVEAYRRVAKACDYPLHLGVTATGLPLEGSVKSSIAIGALLLEGIGDTIRVSLTDQPGQEVRVAKAILESLDLRHFGPKVISCPTCGRCSVDLMGIVSRLEDSLAGLDHKGRKPQTIAVMGCVVNGPGEAREADIGIAFGEKEGMLFKKGKAVKKISVEDCVGALLKEINR